MTKIIPKITDGYISFDGAQCIDLGKNLAEQYQNARPFPHIVIDEFLPSDFLRELSVEFPERNKDSVSFDRHTERFKTQFSPSQITNRRLRNLVVELNSPPMLRFLETMTGIPHLIPDPYYIGGGLHETLPGGHLGVHTDFNIHNLLACERRLNLLIYLNDDWLPEYGGHLELWDNDMKACVHKIEPILGRAVVFNTSLGSFHGHPEPLKCPSGRTRRSIATYYYTAPPDGIGGLKARTTVFKVRPQTDDQPDRTVQVDHFLRDWIPPRLYPIARRLMPWKLLERDKSSD